MRFQRGCVVRHVLFGFMPRSPPAGRVPLAGETKDSSFGMSGLPIILYENIRTFRRGLSVRVRPVPVASVVRRLEPSVRPWGAVWRTVQSGAESTRILAAPDSSLHRTGRCAAPPGENALFPVPSAALCRRLSGRVPCALFFSVFLLPPLCFSRAGMRGNDFFVLLCK